MLLVLLNQTGKNNTKVKKTNHKSLEKALLLLWRQSASLSKLLWKWSKTVHKLQLLKVVKHE